MVGYGGLHFFPGLLATSGEINYSLDALWNEKNEELWTSFLWVRARKRAGVLLESCSMGLTASLRSQLYGKLRPIVLSKFFGRWGRGNKKLIKGKKLVGLSTAYVQRMLNLAPSYSALLRFTMYLPTYRNTPEPALGKEGPE